MRALFLTMLLACSGGARTDVVASSAPAEAPPPAEEPAPAAPTACLSQDDCGEGEVCQGEGCGDDQPGTCLPDDRICTMDLVRYCGCDGADFDASGGCPNRRYAHRGPCETPEAAQAAAGAACLSSDDCGEGQVCEGQGCGDDEPGVCQPAIRPCTKDLRPYCGCDGETFSTSGTCPGRRYAAKGPCPAE